MMDDMVYENQGIILWLPACIQIAMFRGSPRKLGAETSCTSLSSSVSFSVFWEWATMRLLSLGVPQTVCANHTVSCLTQHHVYSIGHCGTDMSHKQMAHHDTSQHLNLFKVLPLLLKVIILHFAFHNLFFFLSNQVMLMLSTVIAWVHQCIIYVQSALFLIFPLTMPLRSPREPT